MIISCVLCVSVGGKLPPNPCWGARQGVQPFLWGVGVLLILTFFWPVFGAPINSLKYHLLREALPVLPEWGCSPRCTVLSHGPP